MYTPAAMDTPKDVTNRPRHSCQHVLVLVVAAMMVVVGCCIDAVVAVVVVDSISVVHESWRRTMDLDGHGSVHLVASTLDVSSFRRRMSSKTRGALRGKRTEWNNHWLSSSVPVHCSMLE